VDGKCVRVQGGPRMRVNYVSTDAYIVSEPWRDPEMAELIT